MLDVPIEADNAVLHEVHEQSPVLQCAAHPKLDCA